MDRNPNAPQNPPMPLTTKKATKRRKRQHNGNKPHGMRTPNPIGLIYQTVTDHNVARIATQEEEMRLSTIGPSTSRKTDMQVLW